VKVTWTDGTEGEVNGWTSLWTRTDVCVVRETAPPYHRSGCGPQTSGGERTKRIGRTGNGRGAPVIRTQLMGRVAEARRDTARTTRPCRAGMR
jgi:hypothetical protein